MSERKTAKRRTSRPRMLERRQFRVLREAIDELITFVRHVSRNANHMSEDELNYAQQRLEWLADEIWRLVLEGDED